MSNFIVDQLIEKIKSKSETDRQNSQSLRLSCYLDDYEKEIVSLLRKQFHPDNFDRLYPMFANYYNLFKKIINLKSVIYKKEAVRRWYKRDGKKEDDKYQDLIDNSNLNTAMQLCNKLTNINNTSFMRIVSDNQNIKYTAIPSELFSIMQSPDNPEEITALLHQVVIQDSYTKLPSLVFGQRSNTDKYILKYFYWDYEKYIILDNEMKITSEIDNPYKDKDGKGIIPYVLGKNFPLISGSIWNETVNSDLYFGTIQVNVLQTYLNNLIKTSGYRQPWITGIERNEVEKLNNKANDVLQPIVMTSENSKIGSFQLSDNITEVKDVIHDIISEIADNHGISFSSRVSSAQKMSGKALQISQESINNIREEQQPFFREMEKEIAEKSVIIANTDLRSNIDIEGNFSINFYEEKPELEEKDKIDVNNWYLTKNLKSLVDVYKELDPDCPDDKTAEKRIIENKKINDEYKNTIDLTPDDDDDEDDDNAES